MHFSQTWGLINAAWQTLLSVPGLLASLWGKCPGAWSTSADWRALAWSKLLPEKLPFYVFHIKLSSKFYFQESGYMLVKQYVHKHAHFVNNRIFENLRSPKYKWMSNIDCMEIYLLIFIQMFSSSSCSSCFSSSSYFLRNHSECLCSFEERNYLLVSPGCRYTVEWSHGSGGLQGQHRSRRRLLFWAKCYRTVATEIQPAVPDPLTWVQTWRLWILPQPQGGWTFYSSTGVIPPGPGWAKALLTINSALYLLSTCSK